MREYINLGPVPSGEPHQLVGLESYNQSAALAECERYRTLLSDRFGPLPGNARFAIVSMIHSDRMIVEGVTKRYTVALQINNASQDEVLAAERIVYALPIRWHDRTASLEVAP